MKFDADMFIFNDRDSKHHGRIGRRIREHLGLTAPISREITNTSVVFSSSMDRQWW